MLPLIIALVLTLTGADTKLTCTDSSWTTPHSNYDYVVFVTNDTYYPAVYAETVGGKDLYQYQFPQDGDAPTGELVFTHVVIDGEELFISNPDKVVCGAPQRHTIYLPIAGR